MQYSFMRLKMFAIKFSKVVIDDDKLDYTASVHLKRCRCESQG